MGEVVRLPGNPAWTEVDWLMRPGAVFVELPPVPPLDAPAGRCKACRWLAPLTAEGLCGRCETDRVLEDQRARLAGCDPG